MSRFGCCLLSVLVPGMPGNPYPHPFTGCFVCVFLFLFRCRIGAAFTPRRSQVSVSLTPLVRICAGGKSRFTPAFTVKKMCDRLYIFLAHILHGNRSLMSAA